MANRAKSPGTFGRIGLGSLGQAGGCARDAVGDCDGVTAGTTLRCCGIDSRRRRHVLWRLGVTEVIAVVVLQLGVQQVLAY